LRGSPDETPENQKGEPDMRELLQLIDDLGDALDGDGQVDTAEYIHTRLAKAIGRGIVKQSAVRFNLETGEFHITVRGDTPLLYTIATQPRVEPSAASVRAQAAVKR
jgi:hypothetical protein